MINVTLKDDAVKQYEKNSNLKFKDNMTEDDKPSYNLDEYISNLHKYY